MSGATKDSSELATQKKMKWNIVYTKQIAGTVSQDKVDETREFIKKNPDVFMGIWNIELNERSSDEEIAKYLMLEHETIEEEDLDVEIEEVGQIEA